MTNAPEVNDPEGVRARTGHRVGQRAGAAWRWVLQPVLVVVILVVGFLSAMGLSSSREAPRRTEQESYAPLVRTTPVRVTSRPVTVRGNGTLQPRTRVDLIPQVGGRVVEMHPALRPGGRFAPGEVLAAIEAIDYELALAQARAEVSAASTALEVQLAEASAAVEEWGRLSPSDPVPPLVGREPQIQEARARVAAAEAQVESAKLNLGRTRLSLPFAGAVVDSSVDVGQVLTANQSIGTVYATDVFEVPVPLAVEELAWVRLPGDSPGETGSPARVTLRLGERELVLEGRAARLEARLNDTSRLSRLIVEVPTDGLGPMDAARVLPGLFVDVEVDGGTLEGVAAVPREALRENGVVGLVEEGRLRVVSPRIERASGKEVLVSGLADGAVMVTSNLEVVTDGMQVRLLEKEPQ